MELHVSGVKVPPLGSMQDRIYRDFLTRRSYKEVTKNRIVTLAAIATANMSKSPKALLDDLLNTYSDYMNLEMFMETVKQETETMMKEEFEFWRKVRPKINISKDGKGASLSVESLKPVKAK